MFTIISIIVVGALLGMLIRSPKAPAFFAKLLNIIVYVLLTAMGIVVGGNKDIVNNLSTIGLKAFIITAGAVLGSMSFAYIIYRCFFKEKEAKQ
ncbi:MAG: LysO family transporter [Rikenellaceae bacterium]